MEPSRVQILVVIANIPTRTLKTEVEKGSMWTAVEHGSVGPKRYGNSVLKGGVGRCLITDKDALLPAKGNRVNIPEPEHGERPACGTSAATQTTSETSAEAPVRVLFPQ
ncbi:hypothetical protein DPMN_057162 [Dreissena polymorpha]|uniref:Uncharacterized protein n=1 Tax=Dreissena polymorpha TaxID=45954 RepID=A0A9D4HU57_DREPO|nr:hypothetical protein DPMN_057162 [Dreissena polymorpha]